MTAQPEGATQLPRDESAAQHTGETSLRATIFGQQFDPHLPLDEHHPDALPDDARNLLAATDPWKRDHQWLEAHQDAHEADRQTIKTKDELLNKARETISEQEGTINWMQREKKADRRMLRAMREEARKDDLTRLGNKEAFYYEASFLMGTPEEVSDHGAALLMMDLDGFKQPNDQLGHVFGDRLLKEVADEMTEQIRSDDLAYRWGGDEFAIIFRNLPKDPKEAQELLDSLQQRLRSAITNRLQQAIQSEVSEKKKSYTGNAEDLGVSMGLAMYDANKYRKVEEWVEAADRQLHPEKQAKKNGPTKIEVVDVSE